MLHHASEMNLEEQELAKLVWRKAPENQGLMAFARHLRDDHGANEQQVRQLAGRKRISLERAPASTIDKKLLQTAPREFPSAFLDEVIKQHQDSIATLEAAKEQLGDDGESSRYIDKTLPVMQAHLKMAEQLRQEIPGASGEVSATNATKPHSDTPAHVLKLR
jgi:putative membrane protein